MKLNPKIIWINDIAKIGLIMNQFLIDLDNVEIYEAGASLITLLAYPGEKKKRYGRGFTPLSAAMRFVPKRHRNQIGKRCPNR